MIVAFLYALPHGIVGTLFRRSTALPDAAAPAGRQPTIATTINGDMGLRSAGEADGAIVALQNVHMSFGGVRALNGISLAIQPGTIHALIGPNGAGKTALLNVLSGYYRPTQGAVLLGARDVTGLAPHRIARLGIARTFQTAQLFGSLTVLQNVLAGFAGQVNRRFIDSALITLRLQREEAGRRTVALELLAFVGFNADPHALASSLPFGHQRLVEIARALAMNPALIAMDEPAAGLNPKEIQDLDELITRIGARGIAVLLVEHHMDLVMGISNRITVLDHGEKLAEGSPSQIQANPRVIEAYLGAEDLEEAPAG
jgi:branched-chain amino acid transport system permease protein